MITYVQLRMWAIIKGKQQKDLLSCWQGCRLWTVWFKVWEADWVLRSMLRCRSDNSVLWLRLFGFRCRVRVCVHMTVEDDQISPVEHSWPFFPTFQTQTHPNCFSQFPASFHFTAWLWFSHPIGPCVCSESSGCDSVLLYVYVEKRRKMQPQPHCKIMELFVVMLCCYFCLL